MYSQNTLFSETVEEIYQRVFQTLKPRTPLPSIRIRFRKYASATSRIRLAGDRLTVDISDLLEQAPAPVQEALAYILLSKLYRKPVESGLIARYRHYFNNSDIRRNLRTAKLERGRKHFRAPQGNYHDLTTIFEGLNQEYFAGLMEKPQIGWSLRSSRTTLGHYDPTHHVIVISSIFDTPEAPLSAVRLVMFHEMLHLKYPTEHRTARRCVHTPEFKAAEKQFQDYELAKAELKGFLHPHPGR